MQSLIEAVSIAGLLLLTGSCFFQCLIGIGGTQYNESASHTARNKTALIIGLILFAAGGIAQRQELMFTAGQILLAGTVCVAAIVGWRRDLAGSRLLAVVGSLGLVFLQTVTSHSALEPGLLPTLSHFVHAAAAAIWAGGLLHLLLQTWTPTGNQHADLLTARLARRYALLSLVVLVVLGITGGLLAFVHIHNGDAMNSSVYGAAFKLKSLAAILLLVTVSINCLRNTSAETNGFDTSKPEASPLTRRRLLLVEALLLLVIIFSTGVLAARQPVGVAPFLNPQSWIIDVDGMAISVALQPVSGSAGRARFEIAAEPPNVDFPNGTLADFSVVAADGTAGQHGVEAIPIGPNAFLGEAVLATPGAWQFVLTLDIPDQGAQHGTHMFTLPEPPLRDDMLASLRLVTIMYSRANQITFAVGLLLILIAAWSVRLALQRRAPAWLMPASLINAALGVYLVLSVAFVKTYPSSFWPNPEPFTATSIRQGEPIYQRHCSECHGIAGLGDGPWAIANRGSIPDLTAPHMDSHTDGEIYWWIRYGIPSLDMPPLGDELSDSEIWTAINFVRGLRHGTPPEI